MTPMATISADSHVIEPPNLWLDYIVPSYRERAPHVEIEDGNDVFKCEDVSLIQVGSVSGAGKPSEQLGHSGTYATTMPGAWDPHARLGEIAPDGIEAEVLYPSIALRMFALKDQDYLLECFKAYNSWMADFVDPYPDRFKGIGLVPNQDLESAVGEMKRVKEIGLSGVALALYPGEDRHYDDPMFDPIWQNAQDMSIPVSLHILTERRTQSRPDPITNLTNQTIQADVQTTLSRMILSGVFRRFPGLKVISAENDVGWAGYFVERLDYIFERRKNWQPLPIPRDVLPSEYFKQSVYLTFMRDRSGILVRDMVGIDNIMWSSDYPHLDSTFPKSQEMIAYLTDGLTDDERRKIVAGNVANLFGFN